MAAWNGVGCGCRAACGGGGGVGGGGAGRGGGQDPLVAQKIKYFLFIRSQIFGIFWAGWEGGREVLLRISIFLKLQGASSTQALSHRKTERV